MDVKTFDLVEAYGIPGRVMSVLNGRDTVKVSGIGNIKVSAIKLVESVSIPTFEVGDKVTIASIPIDEQLSYTYGWNDRMSEMAKQSYQNGTIYIVTKVWQSSENDGFYYKLNDEFVFAPYHLKKIVDYDIV